MFPYNPAAPYQQYNGMGAVKLTLNPSFLPCIQEQQAKLGRKLTNDEVATCLKGGTGTGIPLWVWIAGGAVLAGAGYWFFVR